MSKFLACVCGGRIALTGRKRGRCCDSGNGQEHYPAKKS